jgi:hypothetical protein
MDWWDIGILGLRPRFPLPLGSLFTTMPWSLPSAPFQDQATREPKITTAVAPDPEARNRPAVNEPVKGAVVAVQQVRHPA